MTKRSLAALCCLLWGLAVPALAEDAPPLLVRVTDGNGKPVAGATVRALPEQGYPEKPEIAIREETSAEGTARISGLPADWLSDVLVEREGHAPELRSLPGGTREVRIALRPGGLLVGQVVDEKGRPVAGAEVELAGTPFQSFSWEIPQVADHLALHRARTGPAGRFRFRDLPSGRFGLTIRHARYATFVADQPVEGSTTGRLGTFVLRRGETLRGTITGVNGRPVAGARVWALLQSERESGGFPAPSTATAADGSFAIPHRGPGVELWVCADGFLVQSTWIQFPEEPASMQLLPAGSVEGRVLGLDGSPMAGATVTVSRTDGVYECGTFRITTPCDEEKNATTDEEGRFQLARLWPAWYTVSVSAPGRMDAVSSPLRVTGGEAAEVELRFKEGSVVTGRVVDPEGRPVPGARVQIVSETSRASTNVAADGSFRIEGVSAGRHELAAYAEEHGIAERVLEVSVAEVRVDLVLEPDPWKRSTVRGRVLGPDGAPVEGARVSSPHQSVHSGWDGSFTVEVPRSGPYAIQATKRGLAPGAIQLPLEGGRVDGVEIQMRTGTRVTGRVTGLTAEEMRRVTIQLREQEGALPVSADTEGRFEIGPVAAGTWEVEASLEGRTARAEITANPEQAEASVELQLPAVREVSGRVLDSEGTPLAGIDVSFHAPGQLFASAWTRADGSFSAAVPEGDFKVSVQHGARERTQPVGAETGPVTGLEIALPHGVTLRGRILGVPPWERTIVHLEGSSSHFGEVDLDGGWSLQGLPPGRWTLSASRDATSQKIRRTIEVPDDPGVSEIEIDLDFTGTEGDDR